MISDLSPFSSFFYPDTKEKATKKKFMDRKEKAEQVAGEFF
ncbi:MAG: hypothetical protein ACRDEB_09755 [Chitinophagaceae bacterium]